MDSMRLSGLASGMDTDAIVEQLMKAQRLKATKIQNKITTTEWKQEKWKALNSKVYSFYTNQLSKLRFQSSFLIKKAVSSNTSKVEVITTNSNAPDGTHNIKVKQLASAQFVTGDKLGENVNLSTKLKDLGFDVTDGTTIHIETANKPVNLDVRESTTLGDFINALKSAGLNANFDTTHKRIFISSKESGAGNGFSITTSASEVVKYKNLVRDLFNYDSLSSAEKNTIDGYLDSYLTANDKTSVRNNLLNIRHQQIRDNFIEKYINDPDNFAAAEEVIRNGLAEGENLSAEEMQERISKYLKQEAEEKLDKAYKAWQNNEDISSETNEDIIEAFNAFKNSENSLDEKLDDYLAAYSSQEVNPKDSQDDVTKTSKLAGLGLGEIVNKKDGTVEVTGNGNKKVEVVNAQDAVIIYNNVELTGSSNTFSVNGLTLSLKGVTSDDEQISITVSNNTEGIYNMIKDFIKSYNELLLEFNSAYYAESARGYDPLTDEDKEKMTDDQIEKWEKKIKDSLLRRDTTLGSLLNIFRSITSDTVTVNDREYSLASFGITTKDYNEKGILYISGDEDFSALALSDNKLREAINNDPDTVMQVFNTLAANLYKSLTEKMRSTSLSSALTVYNDKELERTLKDYKSELRRMESKLADLEEKYYRQFSAMESALEKLNSQSSYLSALLGTNNR